MTTAAACPVAERAAYFERMLATDACSGASMVSLMSRERFRNAFTSDWFGEWRWRSSGISSR